MKTKQFIIEIQIPENTGDLCWDLDETGLQALHDCIISPLHQINLREVVSALNEREEYKDFINMQNTVRESFKVISQ